MPPGRLIPTKQLWGGNPVVFIKDLDIGEVWANYTKSYITSSLGEASKNEFTTWNSAYMQRVSTLEDADPTEDSEMPASVSTYYRNLPKYYL